MKLFSRKREYLLSKVTFRGRQGPFPPLQDASTYVGMLAAYVKLLARDVGSLHVKYWLGMLVAYVKILARDVGSLHVKYWGCW